MKGGGAVKLYQGGEPGHQRDRFVKTGEFRPPRRDEYYLSGAIPEVWRARGNLSSPYYIMRPATHEETFCPMCGQVKP